MPEPQTALPDEVREFTRPTRYIDSDSPEVQDFVAAALADLPPDADKTQVAIRLFEAVRDGLRYDPYSFALDEGSYRASAIAGTSSAFCVPKAILLTACLRAAGIPAAAGFADVKNHLNTPRLREVMGTDLFIYHGYVKLWFEDGRSFKVTPAFNSEMCARFGVKPLVFDGTADALFHEFDQGGRRHMEYVHDHGIFADPPIPDFLRVFCETYPRLETLNRERIRDAAAVGDPGFAATGGSDATG